MKANTAAQTGRGLFQLERSRRRSRCRAVISSRFMRWRSVREVRVAEIMRPASACCGAGEPVEEARRKLHEQGATSLTVVDEAGSCCGTVSVRRLEKS
jgi:CBS-domain-containing membrane protein